MDELQLPTDIAGEISLYFGCRHENQDFLYRDEWSQLLVSSDITHFYTAFSRDGNQLKKTYVQQRIEESGAQVI